MDILELKPQIIKSIETASNLIALDEIRINVLGKKGSLTEIMKTLSNLPLEERKIAGQNLNVIKNEITEALDIKKSILEKADIDERLATESVDVTLPINPFTQGRIHPVSQVIDEVLSIFAQMGFDLAEGPDIEDDWHNFEALNMPPAHPARQGQATFFLNNSNALLRTQTSGVQIRIMENQKQPPIKIVAPGRTYRRDYDTTHTPMFHQIEGLMIDKTTTLADLKGIFVDFIKLFFGTNEVPVRFRPHYFPFTEPSFEADVGGSLAKALGKEWVEVLGCGMVDPNVLKNCGLDPNEYQGLAFGFGIDRFAMLKYGIPDLRSFFDADMRWIKHYGFVPLDIPTLTSGLDFNGGQKI